MLAFLLANLLGADLGVSFVLTIASALLWEILENTKFVIDLFRENSGPSEDYRGDSKVNVVGDVLSCTMGYALAVTMSRWGGILPSIAWFVAMELVMAAKYRDNMVLMGLQIIAPSEAVSKWQLEVIPEKFPDRMGYWRKRRRSNLYSTMHLAKKKAFQRVIVKLMKLRSSD